MPEHVGEKIWMVSAMINNELIEKLAELEHEQWMHWTKYMIDNFTEENIERWRRQINTPYNKLSEKEKESDKKWAYKVAKIVREHQVQEEIKDKYDAKAHSEMY